MSWFKPIKVDPDWWKDHYPRDGENYPPPQSASPRHKKPKKPKRSRKLTKYPTQEKYDKIAKKWNKLFVLGREKKYRMAVDSLDLYFKGKGGAWEYSTTWLRSDPKIKKMEEKNTKKMEREILKKCFKLKDGQTHNFRAKEDVTDGPFLPDSDLYFASHISTIISQGIFTLYRSGKDCFIEGKIYHKWHDVYDFKKSFKYCHPKVGCVSGKEAHMFEDWGGAKPFEMFAQWQHVLRGKVTINSRWIASKNKIDYRWSFVNGW